MHCTVVTASQSAGIGNGLTYDIKGKDVQIGSPVQVQLRKRIVEGLVVSIVEKRDIPEYEIKEIQTVLSEYPLLTSAQVQTAKWMSEYYLCTIRQALGPWLPGTIWRRLLPQKNVSYRLTANSAEKLKGKSQQAIISILKNKEWMSERELRERTRASLATLRALQKRGVIEREEKPVEPKQISFADAVKNVPVLNTEQQAALESIRSEKKPSLLFGITGSGKTEVFRCMIAETIKQGKQAIYLVPEILLTEHIIDRLRQTIDSKYIAVVHSKLTPKERRETWRRIHRGEVALVVGSRSALFSPLKNLGLMVIDEEHEWTYKNEQTPRYHARDTAEVLAKNSGAKLVLGSATPSLETWASAKEGRFHLSHLKERYKNAPLPTLRIIDLAEAKFGRLYPFTQPLLDAIGERLKRKEQSVLFLNRRGMASALLCLECRRRITSPASQLPYAVHHDARGRPYLLDHLSGLRAEIPVTCPHCKSTNLITIGAGTQKIEQILTSQFPSARILRADSDALPTLSSIRRTLEMMVERKADILLGTQMVAKGLDLPGVTLAAVLLADIGLSLPHFRAGERIFQLLSQLTGRSGRHQPGEVIIQTYRPQAPEIHLAAAGETSRYLDEELRLRTATRYPPATSMIRCIVRGDRAAARAQKFSQILKDKAGKSSSDVIVQGAPTFFSSGREWQVLLRGTNIRSLFHRVDFTDITIDVDPTEVF